MATGKSRLEHVCDQMEGAGVITARPMFGEFGVYCDGRLVALVCDDQLFLKPTPQAMALLGPVPMLPAYPGGKPMALVDEALDDADLLGRVVALIAREVPEPKPRKSKRAATAQGD